MMSYRSLIFALLAQTSYASFDRIAGYEPQSLVTDHNAIDLDQQAIEFALAEEQFELAKAIYQNGAFSKSVATLKLTSALSSGSPKGTKVTGQSENGVTIGTLYEAAKSGDQTIRVQYQARETQGNYLDCQVGANPNPNFSGCFLGSATIEIEGLGSSIEYEYDVANDNTNERTIQGFSTSAEDLMYRCANCPYETYEKFYNYYGRFDYANQWILAALDGKQTDLMGGRANFGGYSSEGLAEAAKKGTAYMAIWMYVIREMEDAIDDCKDSCELDDGCNADPVNAWDEAVAFYTGSQEGSDGSGDGYLLYGLADKRCINFKTCGDLANDDSGTSHVNLEILKEFKGGLANLLAGNCNNLRKNKERIEKLMTVPLVQGALRYAYLQSTGTKTEKAEAEGATFAAAVLPVVNHCDQDDAEIIYDNLKVGHSFNVDFQAVKKAFERNYDCMGIRCGDVGGLYNGVDGYFEGFAPCGSSGSASLGYSVGITATVVVAVTTMVGLFL